MEGSFDGNAVEGVLDGEVVGTSVYSVVGPLVGELVTNSLGEAVVRCIETLLGTFEEIVVCDTFVSLGDISSFPDVGILVGNGLEIFVEFAVESIIASAIVDSKSTIVLPLCEKTFDNFSVSCKDDLRKPRSCPA